VDWKWDGRKWGEEMGEKIGEREGIYPRNTMKRGHMINERDGAAVRVS